MKRILSAAVTVLSLVCVSVPVSAHEKLPSNTGSVDLRLSSSKLSEAHTHTHTHTSRYTPTNQQTSRFVSATTYACHEGYYLHDGSCIQKSVLNFEHVCESGSRATPDGLCVHTTKTVKSCPEGEVMEGDFCVSSLQDNAIPVCPEGYTNLGQKCVLSLKSENICSKGSVYVDEHICAHKASAKVKCPDEYVFEGSLCVKKIRRRPMHQCPTGMTLSEKTNLCEFQIKSVPVCPTGTYLHNGSCVKTVDKVSVCPKSDDAHTYIPYDSNTCVFMETIKPMSVCHNGGELNENNKCVVNLNVSLQPMCAGDFSLINDVCERTITSPAKMICPDMYELNGDICLRNLSYDCSETIQNVVCEDPMVRDTKGPTSTHPSTIIMSHGGTNTHTHIRSNAPPRILGRFVAKKHTKKNTHTTAYSHTRTQSQLLPYCKLQQHIIPHECNKTLHAQVDSVCENSLYMGDATCAETEFQTPEYVCKANGDTSNCHVTEYQDPIFMCPDGYISITASQTHINTHHHRTISRSMSKLKCVKEHFKPKEYMCPENTHGDMCELTVVPRMCDDPSGLCTTHTKREPVSYVCPAGFTYTTHTLVSSAYAPQYSKRAANAHALHTKGGSRSQRKHKKQTQIQEHDTHTHTSAKIHSHPHVQQKVVCTQILYAVPETFCDEGYERIDDFTCAKLHPTEKLTEAVSVEPTHVCNDGFVLDSLKKRCERKYEKVAEKVCPNGYTQADGVCVKHVKPKQICPSGSTYAKGRCWVYKKTQPYEVQTSLRTLPHTSIKTLRQGFKHTASVVG